MFVKTFVYNMIDIMCIMYIMYIMYISIYVLNNLMVAGRLHKMLYEWRSERFYEKLYDCRLLRRLYERLPERLALPAVTRWRGTLARSLTAQPRAVIRTRTGIHRRVRKGGQKGDRRGVRQNICIQYN